MITYEFAELSIADEQWMWELVEKQIHIKNNWDCYTVDDLTDATIQRLLIRQPEWQHILLYAKSHSDGTYMLTMYQDDDHTLLDKFNRLKALKAFL